MRNYVIINGVNSNTINGLAINELPPITKPPMRVLQEEIDGRDGDITTNLGYGAYDKVMTIGLFHTFDINQIIAFFNGSGTIVFSNEPDKKYNYKIIDQIDYEKLISFKTATVTFHCQPFKYPVEEEPIEVTYTYVEGEGETLTLNPTSEAPMVLDLKGNTSQYSTTGKNLLPNISTQTLNGITITNNNDGSYTLNGTASTNTYFDFFVGTFDSSASVGYYLKEYNFDNIKNIMGISSSSPLSYRISTSNRTSIQQVNGNTTNGYIQIEDNGSNLYLAVRIHNGGSLSNIKIKPMLVASSSSLTAEVEPYTGGSPAPSPSYPFDIHNVSGDNTIEICGKNVININGIYSSSSTTNLERNYENGIATLTWYSGFSLYMVQDNSGNNFIPLPDSTKTYTISFKHKGNALYLRFDESDINIIETNVDSDYTTYSYTFSGLSEIKVKFVRKDNTGTAYLKDFQIELGSTATTYEAYTEQSQLISLGVENYLQDEYIQEPEGNTINAILKKGTYTIFTEDGETFGNNIYFKLFDNNGTAITTSGHLTTANFTINFSSSSYYYYGGSSREKIIFTLDNDYKLNIGMTGATGTRKVFVIKGNTPQYVSTTPIELCKIGTYQDYIYKEDDKWYLHKEIGKVVLDGSESWTYDSSHTRFYATIYSTATMVRGQGLCNYYRYGNSVNSGCFDINVDKKTIYIFTPDSSITTSSAFKTWLSTHNTIVYYVLDTPTDTEITDETLISQLEAIKDMTSYNGTTNISQVNNDKPFILKVKASKDDSGIATINNIGNIYSKPTIDIEGSGNVNVYLNGNQLFVVNVTDEVVIDSTNLEAYNPNTSALENRNVTGNIGNLKLNKGNNTIAFSGGLTRATITDYVRYL